MVLVLSVWGKVAAMGIAALVVVFVLLVVVCFVGPGCWGYEWLNAEEERERRRRRLMATVSGGDFMKLSMMKRPDSNYYDTVGSASSLLGRMESRDSTYSSMSEGTDRSSFRSTATSVGSSDAGATAMSPVEVARAAATAETSPPAAVAAEEAERAAGPPQLHLTLQFVGGEERSALGRLLIGIKGASRLPAREYPGGLEPYVALTVMRCSWPLHRRAGAPLHRLRTRALRHTRDPRFDQTFALDARRHEIRDWSLRVTALDQDRHGNPTELCYVDVSLRDVKTLMRGEEAVLNLPLQISDKEAGEVLVGLSFLPTAQRLSVSVLRAARLRYLQVANSLADFHPYVRVIQLHGSTGRSVRRKKTTARPGCDAPDFNETLTFDLSAPQLETAVFLVLLCSRAPAPAPAPTGPAPAPAESKGATPAVAPPRDRCLGKVALGRGVGSRHARHHWLAVMQSPRSVHSAWHPIK
ncbi:hypothetical protein R5R35_003273 [Gryllus longicercus]|uniref:C2 domain-containing protein n=1 Tax=Gryllus longicercus TaxID=2509291 RepID=A0AAN9VN39_9ORTH